MDTSRLRLPFELLVPTLCDKLCEFTWGTSVKLFLRLMETLFIFVCNSLTLIAECMHGRRESKVFHGAFILNKKNN